MTTRVLRALIALTAVFCLVLQPNKVSAAVCNENGSITVNTTWDSSCVHVVGEVIVSTRATLTINPGSILKIQGYIQATGVGSKINVAGSSTAPIIITSFKDDSVGGDTNGDGSSSSPSQGECSRPRYQQYLPCYPNTYVRYGGGLLPNRTSTNGMVVVPANESSGGGSVVVTNSTLEHSANNGIHAWFVASVVVQSTTIRNNSIYGIDVRFTGQLDITDSVIRDSAPRGVYTDATSVLVESTQFISNNIAFSIGHHQNQLGSFTNNSMVGNSSYGFLANGLPSVNWNAKNNYCGSSDGPFTDDEGCNTANGHGDKVSYGVDFAPWLTSDPNTGPPIPPTKTRKAIVFLQGVCSSIEEGTSAEVLLFKDLQRRLKSEYGYKDSDFLAYNYKGGHVNNDGVWYHNPYDRFDPTQQDFRTTSWDALHNQLLTPYKEAHKNEKFLSYLQATVWVGW